MGKGTLMQPVLDLSALQSRHIDIILALMFVSVISLMIFPMPTVVIDTMIALNLCCSLGLLIISLYIPSATALSTFPTILLFTTLFRLSLNVCTTRQILLNADAGKIIFTFGDMVVGGNFIVGGVVFLIITIVQFIVIAKGSERIAEVSARFTLDGMPGKQMSIDADMRAGVIDMDEAVLRRQDVQDESRLYGAMDGAMKFVKGDAIAGLIIAIINIIGGIAIGTIQKSMTFGDAVQKYSILTIGDGLVSQIPALFISVTSGIIITRIDTKGDTQFLAQQITSQLSRSPKALVVISITFAALSLVPGFPKLQFLIIGGIVGSLAYFINEKAQVDEADDQSFFTVSKQGDEEEEEEKTHFSMIVPLLVDVSIEWEGNIDNEGLNAQFADIGRGFYYEFGVPFPGIMFRYNHHVASETYQVLVNEIPMYHGKLPLGKFLVRTDRETLKELRIEYDTDDQFLPNTPTIWVNGDQLDVLDQNMVSYFSAEGIICSHVSHILHQNAVRFLGMPETKYLLDQMEVTSEDMVTELYKVTSLKTITEVFQNLVKEEISIRNLHAIVETIITAAIERDEPEYITQMVRIKLKQYISYKFSTAENVLQVNSIEADLESYFRDHIQTSLSGKTTIKISPEFKQAFLNYIADNISDKQDPNVIVSAVDIRSTVHEILSQNEIEIPVLSFEELSEEVKLKPMLRIGLDEINEGMNS